MSDIKGVEIFRSGEWNGDKYTDKDLDDIVFAFDKVGYRPPVKLGHDDSPAARAWGWIERVYRRGSTLLADLTDLPNELYDLIRARGFDSVSAEIFWNLTRDGKTYRRALKALALLGAHVPAVSNLAPLRSVVHETSASWRIYTMPNEEFTDNPGLDLDAAVKALSFERNITYREALGRIRTTDLGREMIRAYGQQHVSHFAEPPAREYRTPATYDAAKMIDGKARALVAADPKLDYRQAVHQVLANSPDLRRAYGESARA